MPTSVLNGTRYAFIDEGEGPLLVFGHGLLASREMFRAQIDALSDRYRVISLDWPGHGESDWPRAGGWTFWDLAEDSAALVRQLGEEQAVFAGLSQGGFAFMRLALKRPQVVRGLILMDTSAKPEPAENQEPYRHLAEILRHGSDQERRGAAEIAATILYGEPWRQANPEQLEHEIEIMLAHPREGLYAAAHAVFDRDDISDRIGEITAPTLVMCGELDTATVPDRSEQIAAAIPNSELVMIPAAGHHSAIENPAPVTVAIERFLATL